MPRYGDSSALNQASRGLRLAIGQVQGPLGMILLPACGLLAYWLGGEAGLLLLAIAGPLLLALSGARPQVASDQRDTDREASLSADFSAEPQLLLRLDQVLRDIVETGRNGACFILYFDQPARLRALHGQAMFERLLGRTNTRLLAALREGDMVARVAADGFAVVLPSLRDFGLESAVQLAARLQATASSSLTEAGVAFHPSVSIGFCMANSAPAPMSRSWLDAARIAAEEAQRHGPAAIRAFQADMVNRRADRAELRLGLERALDDGQIRPWFQPQLSTDTGAVSGFEALARWHHPERGVLAPADFLPLIEDIGLSTRLGEVVLYATLSALTRWDAAGHQVPCVSVNFSAAELRDPQLPDRLKWELDRFDLQPSRLTVEVLETVAARSDDDMILCNLARIAELGCGIDLDDFGTGQASIANIRRFSVRRIKIDRCFVTHVDADPEQKKMVAAILALCERLELETVAEGVETRGEHATMAQLGCSHVQGFGIAKPMSVEQSFGWLARHEQGLIQSLRMTEW